MNCRFDEAYAMYLSSLEKLDQADHVDEKNILFRQITTQLSDLESRLNSLSFSRSLSVKRT